MSVNSQLGFPLKVLEEMNENPAHSAAAAAAIASAAAPTAAETSPQATRPAGKTPFFENTYQKIRQQQQARPQRLFDNGAALSTAHNTTLPSNGTVNSSATAAAPGAPATTNATLPDIRLPEYVERAIESMSTGRQMAVDSGISTPVSPPLSIGSALVSPASLSPSAQRLQQQHQQRINNSSSIAVPASSVVPESPSPSPSTDHSTLTTANAHPLSNCEDVHFTFNGTTTQLKTLRSTYHPQVIQPPEQQQQSQQLKTAAGDAERPTGDLTKNGRS